jgi:diguanylate cyclase (GGDEF)-like protein
MDTQLGMSDKPKIMCVDDEIHILDALDRILRFDFQVLKATSGDQALVQLEQNKDVAVILSDFMMPRMSGIDFLNRAKQLVPNATRVMLSGQIDHNQLSDAINTSAIHRFLVKPWDNEVLRLQMLEALQTHGHLSANEKLRTLSITDTVTQLTNHRYFQEKLIAELKNAEKSNTKLCVAMIDVDHFKSFNDRYGHPQGDRLLTGVAQRIQNHFPEKGIASRYGGEEFAVILPNTSIEMAFQKVEDLRLDLEMNAFIGAEGRPAFVTVSAGVAEYPSHTRSAADLVSCADQALYQSKQNGRNRTSIYKL